jgi:hypothetical protein
MTYKTAHKQYVIVTTLYIAVTIAAGVAGTIADSKEAWIACAAVVSVGASANMLTWVRRERSREGVERHVGSEAAAFTFFTVFPALFSYSLFELWAGAPRPSVMAIVMVASVIWGAWALAIKRRVA